MVAPTRGIADEFPSCHCLEPNVMLLRDGYALTLLSALCLTKRIG